jgi:hypothetical protein
MPANEHDLRTRLEGAVAESQKLKEEVRRFEGVAQKTLDSIRGTGFSLTLGEHAGRPHLSQIMQLSLFSAWLLLLSAPSSSQSDAPSG